MKRLFLGAAIAMLLMPSVMKAQTMEQREESGVRSSFPESRQSSTVGQINQTIRGQVCDVASGEPMIGVAITEGTTFEDIAKRADKSVPEIVDKFTSLTFPNIAYRVEF
jgi:hypothetical protein